jgi:hypothetical protein
MATPIRPRDDRPFDPAELGRVFTLQLRDSGCGASDLVGRLTHAATGVASHFDSADELIALLRAESARLRTTSTQTPAVDLR